METTREARKLSWKMCPAEKLGLITEVSWITRVD
jgi:hypothetical protein